MAAPGGSGRAGSVRGTAVLNAGTDDELLVTGFRRTAAGTALYVVLVLLSCGAVLLLAYWKPEWRLAIVSRRCSLDQATGLLVKDNYRQKCVVQIVEQPVIDGAFIDNYLMAFSKPSTASRTSTVNEEADMATNERQLIWTSDRPLNYNRPIKTGYYRFFDHHRVRYVWSPVQLGFCRLAGLDRGVTCLSLIESSAGLSQPERRAKQALFGANEIAIEVKSYFRLFVEEVLNPFYVFQLASITLWAVDNYYYYASCIVFITCISIGVALYETKKQSIALRDMVKTPDAMVRLVKSDGDEVSVPVGTLVPGDVISLEEGGSCVMQCDAVLISGGCVVNESMLTGESVPVTKSPLSHQEDTELYSPEEHKRHTLFCGTHVLQTRQRHGDPTVRAVVVRTGFHTSKGELVRAILYPKPLGFKFYRDAIRFILVLAFIAAGGMSYSLWLMLQKGRHYSKIIIRVLDIVTIVVPPALPAAMTVGTVYAQARLKKRGIFCISPPRINLCGKLKVICFDKTGTLTEDGLDLWGVVPVDDGWFQHVVHDGVKLVQSVPFKVAMATCHSLSILHGQLTGDPLDLKMFEATEWELEEPVEDTSNFGNLMPTVVRSIPRQRLPSRSVSVSSACSGTEKAHRGDAAAPPLCIEVGVVRQFTFTSSLQRMSVIARTLGSDRMTLYAKGAPERIVSLCVPGSVPPDFAAVLRRYTMQGYRVIALAYRTLPEHMTWHRALKVPRDQVESDLTFLGLMIMQNMVKPQTAPTIQRLAAANIRTVMITGDNMLTALSVARECRMIDPRERVFLVHAAVPRGEQPAEISFEQADMRSPEDEETAAAAAAATSTEVELQQSAPAKADDLERSYEKRRYHFAVSGKTLAIVTQHFPELLDRILVRGSVFARVSPDQKGQLVEHLKALGYGVGMCGDGANDCVALKAAHAGISLSEAEASVASPFTSNTPNVSCVLTVIREGRAALVTSFGMFKFMALYSFIQFASVLLLYTAGTNLGDQQFLYIDLAIVTTAAILMGYTGAYEQLVAERPMGSLMSLINLFSIFFEMALVFAFQVLAYIYLRNQFWFVPVVPAENEVVNCFESTVIFVVSSFQYLTMAVCFSTGPPFRQPLWKNVAFLMTLLVLLAFSLILLMHPFLPLETFFQMSHIDDKFIAFKVTLLLGVGMNFFISYIMETFVVHSRLLKRLSRAIRRKRQPGNRYKLIEQELQSSPDWPVPGQRLTATASAAVLLESSG